MARASVLRAVASRLASAPVTTATRSGPFAMCNPAVSQTKPWFDVPCPPTHKAWAQKTWIGCRVGGNDAFSEASSVRWSFASNGGSRGVSGKSGKRVPPQKQVSQQVDTAKTTPQAPRRPLTVPDAGGPISEIPKQIDGMPRYPNFSIPGALRLGDYVGTAIFAVTGSLAAAARGMDVLGATVVGTITAVGGGTIRDLLLGKGRRAFWMEEPEYLWICVCSAAGAFLAWPHLEHHFGVTQSDTWMDYLDALGVGAFCVIGVQNGIRAGVPCAAAVACGMFTATFGGVVRDVLMQRPVRILHSYTDIYATTALAGATTYMLVKMAGLPVAVRIVSGVAVAFGLRIAAVKYDLRLPTYAGPVLVHGVGTCSTTISPVTGSKPAGPGFFKPKQDDLSSSVASVNAAKRVPAGSFAALAKGDAGDGVRPPLAEMTNAAVASVARLFR